MNWRPETFAWYFLLKFVVFLRTETRYGESIGGKDEECRVTTPPRIVSRIKRNERLDFPTLKSDRIRPAPRGQPAKPRAVMAEYCCMQNILHPRLSKRYGYYDRATWELSVHGGGAAHRIAIAS